MAAKDYVVAGRILCPAAEALKVAINHIVSI
jgi:hypothetical protein